jgi:hypothetical protein
MIPRFCYEPRLLQYRQMGAFGSQVERLMAQVERRSLKIVLFDDFIASPARIYGEVLEFLDLQPDGRHDFPAVNAARTYRSRQLAAIFKMDGGWVASGLRGARRALRRVGPLRSLKRWMLARPARVKPISAAMRDELRAEFAGEIALLSQLLGRDLTHWLNGSRSRSVGHAAGPAGTSQGASHKREGG